MKLQFVLPLTDFKTYITLSTFRVISIFVFLYSSCVSSVIYILELKDVFLLIGMQFSRYIFEFFIKKNDEPSRLNSRIVSP